MPEHPIPIRQPPTLTDRVLTHPEVAVSAMSAIAGVGLVVDALLGARLLVVVPGILGIALGLTLAVGGAVATTGLLDPHRRSIEQHGWVLLVTACVVLSGTLTFTHSYRLVWWTVMAGAVVGAIRLAALARNRRSARRILKAGGP